MATTESALYEFIETPVFTKRLAALSSAPLELLSAIQADLLDDPILGDVIPGTHGARKARVAGAGRGKRGGFRYIYVYVPTRQQIFLLLIFDKREQSDLSPAQKKVVAGWVDVIRGG